MKASLKMSQMPIYIESAVDYHDYQRLHHATFIFWGEPCHGGSCATSIANKLIATILAVQVQCDVIFSHIL